MSAPDRTEIEISVALDDHGNVLSETVAHTGGNAALDAAALDWVRKGVYSAKTVNCDSVASTYTFHARYSAKWKTLNRIFPFEPSASPVLTAKQQTPKAPEYVRFCSPYQGLTDAEFAEKKDEILARNKRSLETLNAKGFPMPTPLTDEEVIAAVLAHDTDARSINILIKSYHMFGVLPGVPSGDEKSDAVEVREKDGSSKLFLAVFSSDEQFLKLEPVTNDALKRPYEFARFMAAYMLLNDVLADDTLIPRKGCLRGFQVHIDMPGAMREIGPAILDEPQPDPVSERSAMEAYRQFVASPAAPGQAQAHDLSRETIAKLGNTPPIAFIYRDRDATFNEGSEVDVVRLGRGALRTYAMMSIDANGKATMSSAALCVVGDQRCARFYYWP